MKKFFKISLKLLIILVIISAAAMAVLIIDALTVNVDRKKLEGNIYDIKFYDNDNKEIIEADILYPKKTRQKLSAYTYNAFIAVEDKRFYKHKGIDIKRIIKASFNNLASMSFKEGASTISQQLIKNTQLSPDKNIFRKSREIKLALDLERQYSKQEILDMYLNIIYFGSGCYGIENASLYYFNKPAYTLSLNESAALAAIIRAPNYYSPFANYKKMLSRKDVVLKLMYENKMISNVEYTENKGKDIVLCNAQNLSNGYNDYIKACLNELSDILNIPLNELKNLDCTVYTYVDMAEQKKLHDIIVSKEYYKDYESTDSAAILINNKNFSVSALALKSKLPFNKIIRQPGSAIKPVLVYAPALEYNLITPSTEILDEKTDFGDYAPSNYGDKYYGYTEARLCLAKSLNIPALKIFNGVGIEKAKLFAKRSGIRFTDADNNLSLALGGFSEGVNLKDLAASYTPFSNGGYFKTPSFIKMIKDKSGRIIYQDNKEPVQVMRDDTAYLISDMLKESVKSGTASKLSCLNIPLCSKTGTVGDAENNTDAYNISYTSDSTFAVWFGGLTEKKLDVKVTGGSYPTLMMKDIIKNHYNGNIPADIPRPDSVIECDIDTEYLKLNHTLRLASEMTPEKYIKKALFSIHFLPHEYSDCFSLPEVGESEISLKDNNVTIRFKARDYLEYQIVRFGYPEEKIICDISGKEGEIVIKDEISYGKTYQYCIIPQFTNKKLNKTIKGKIFMSEKIVVPYKFSPNEGNDIFDDDYDDENWWENGNFDDID
jgi:membrane peptidoglycan carboxypeptidase